MGFRFFFCLLAAIAAVFSLRLPSILGLLSAISSMPLTAFFSRGVICQDSFGGCLNNAKLRFAALAKQTADFLVGGAVQI